MAHEAVMSSEDEVLFTSSSVGMFLMVFIATQGLLAKPLRLEADIYLYLTSGVNNCSICFDEQQKYTLCTSIVLT